MVGVYIVRNSTTGRVYIGRSKNIEQRWQAHQCDLIRGNHHNEQLQDEWDVYGAHTFLWDVIVLCGIKDLNRREQQVIYTFQHTLGISCYNYLACQRISGSEQPE